MKKIYLERFFDGKNWHHHKMMSVNQHGLIVSIETTTPDNCLHLSGMVGPGLVDLQINGGGGILLNSQSDGAALARLSTAHAGEGTFGVAATLITDRADHWRARIKSLIEALDKGGIDGIVACHLEGPFISPNRPGTHHPDAIRRPEPDDWPLIEALPRRLPTLITIAPECLERHDIERLAATGAILFVGHSECPPDLWHDLRQKNLVTGVTHLFNAMPIGSARAPGLAACALADPDVAFGLIADGHHVGAVFLQMALQSQNAPHRAFLVSDAMPPAGQHPPEGFLLYDQPVTVANGQCLNQQGHLAGAALPLSAGVRHLRMMGHEWDFIFALTITNPARIIGLPSHHGHLIPGNRADFIEWRDDGAVLQVFRGGKRLPQP